MTFLEGVHNGPTNKRATTVRLVTKCTTNTNTTVWFLTYFGLPYAQMSAKNKLNISKGFSNKIKNT